MKKGILIIIFIAMVFISLSGMVNEASFISTPLDPVGMNLNTSMDIALAANVGAALDIQRIELYFENGRADTTVMVGNDLHRSEPFVIL